MCNFSFECVWLLNFFSYVNSVRVASISIFVLWIILCVWRVNPQNQQIEWKSAFVITKQKNWRCLVLARNCRLNVLVEFNETVLFLEFSILHCNPSPYGIGSDFWWKKGKQSGMNFEINTPHTCTCQLASNHTVSCCQNVEYGMHPQICWWMFFSIKSVLARTNVCHQIITFRWQIDIFCCEFSSHLTPYWLFRSHFLLPSLSFEYQLKKLSVLVCFTFWATHLKRATFRCAQQVRTICFFVCVSCAVDAVSELESLIRFDTWFDCNTCSCHIAAHLKPSEINCW